MEPGHPSSIAETALADRERHFNLSLDLLCIAGLDGYFRRVNTSWTRILGWSESELLLRPVESFIHPDDRARTLQARAGLAQGLLVRGLENRYLCKDGSYRWLSWQSTIEPGGSTVFAIARDVTDQRRIDREALVTGKLESTSVLAGGVAHDFNNLLTSIMLNLEMIALTGSLNASQLRHVKQAQDAAHAAHSTTQQLVTFARGSGSMRKIIDPKNLLIETLNNTLQGSNSNAMHSLPPDLWPVEVDEAQFTLVLRNLVLNAREAMPAGGLVRLSAENVTLGAGQQSDLTPGRYIRISVTDEGPGVAPGIAAKVFDPYFSMKHRGVQKGMGLGLTICHAILARDGGGISMHSEPGRGATFHCHWPASSRHPTSADLLSAAVGQVRSLKVLVMDDEESMREVLAQTLAQFGHVAEVAPSGEAAVAAYRTARDSKNPFDVALLDLTVKFGMGGAETLGQIRREDPLVKAVLMTVKTEETNVPHYRQLGFHAALTKPFHVDHLRLVLEEFSARGASVIPAAK